MDLPRSGRRRRSLTGLLAVVLATAALVGALAWVPEGSAAVGGTPSSGLSVLADATPMAGTIPLAVAFSAKASGGFTPYTYNWSFGDGTPNATTEFANHTFHWASEFRVNVTAVDVLGEIATTSLTVNVTPDPLSVALSAVPSALSAGKTTYLETSVQGGTQPYRFTWSGLPDGCPSQPVENLSCTPLYGGSYVVNVTVTDARGLTQSAMVGLVVSGPGPPAYTPPATTPPNYTYEILAVAIGGAAAVVLAALVRRRARRQREGPAA